MQVEIDGVILDPRTIEQGTDLWHRVRTGHVTASKVADVMAKGKDGGASKTRYNYLIKLVAEREKTPTAEREAGFTSEAIEWGKEQETFARIAYEVSRETFVETTGFWLHPTIKWLGVSPDGLVGDDGLVEIKCPMTTTHIEYVLGGKVPAEYVKQIQCQLWVTNRHWCDFISYDPRVRKSKQLLVVRVERDEKLIAEMESAVRKFLDEVQSVINQLGE